MTVDPLVIGTIDKQAAHIAEMKAEIKRLREGLAVFAKEDSWEFRKGFFWRSDHR